MLIKTSSLKMTLISIVPNLRNDEFLLNEFFEDLIKM